MAYGMQDKQLSNSLFELNFSASKSDKLYLTLKDGHPKVYTTINGEKIWLDRIFIMLDSNTSGLDAKAEYVLFYGTDYNTNKPVKIKYEDL